MTAPTAYLTTAELAELLRQSEGTLRYWRHIGYGPQSFKAGRRVIYDRTVVEAWIRSQQAEQHDARRSA